MAVPEPPMVIRRMMHVEIGLLLAGERSVGQVLGGGRRTHRHRYVFAKCRIGAAQSGFQRGLECGRLDPVADLGAGLRECRDVGDVERGQPSVDAGTQVVMVEKVPEGLCGGGETARHLDAAMRQVGNHLAQRRVLAADARDVGHRQRIQWNDIVSRDLHKSSLWKIALPTAYPITPASPSRRWRIACCRSFLLSSLADRKSTRLNSSHQKISY